MRPRTASATAVLLLGLAVPCAGQAPFLRGDANADGRADLSDGVCILFHLFGGGGPCAGPACLDALDSDDDGALAMADAVFLLGHLFQGTPAPPPPAGPACGLDPTADSLACIASPGCLAGPSVDIVLPRDLDLFSLWSEGRDEVTQVHAVLSRVRLAEGRHRVALDRDTPDLDLADSLSIGPALAEAEPSGPGTFRRLSGEFFTHEYRRGFRGAGLDLTFLIRYRAEGRTTEVLDCARLDEVTPGTGGLAIYIEYMEGAARRTIHLSCFHPDAWRPARQSPYTLVVEDGTEVRYALEDAFLFRGVAGETSNRRLTSARVTLGGVEAEVSGHDRLIHAALHHNASQEHRILFDGPIAGVHGIDVLECATTPGDRFCLDPSLERTRVHRLAVDLARGPALRVVEIRPGSGESAGGE